MVSEVSPIAVLGIFSDRCFELMEFFASGEVNAQADVILFNEYLVVPDTEGATRFCGADIMMNAVVIFQVVL